MAEYYFRFLRYAQSVILGVLLLDTSASLINKIDLSNSRFIIQFLVMLIFLELHIVLTKYHDHKTPLVPYRGLFLFCDLFFLSLFFVVLVKIITKSWMENYEYLEKQSLRVFMILFLLIILRQTVILYLVRRNNKGTKKIGLIISIGADFVGFFMCLAAYLFFPKGILYFSYAGILTFFIYFVVTREFDSDWTQLSPVWNQLKKWIQSIRWKKNI